jgi:nucleoside-diphosphate-sugar epimerase
LRGDFKLVGDGSRFTSRIHVDDLAELLLASDRAPGETFVVGDLAPCPQLELVSFLCERLGLPLPGSVAPEDAHETRSRNRRVNPARALQRLGVTLAYPTYRDAFASLSRTNPTSAPKNPPK